MLVIAKDTDILVILATIMPHIEVVYFGTSSVACIYIRDIQDSVGDTQRHILCCHAISGCDSVSTLYGKEKSLFTVGL